MREEKVRREGKVGRGGEMGRWVGKREGNVRREGGKVAGAYFPNIDNKTEQCLFSECIEKHRIRMYLLNVRNEMVHSPLIEIVHIRQKCKIWGWGGQPRAQVGFYDETSLGQAKNLMRLSL